MFGIDFESMNRRLCYFAKRKTCMDDENASESQKEKKKKKRTINNMPIYSTNPRFPHLSTFCINIVFVSIDGMIFIRFRMIKFRMKEKGQITSSLLMRFTMTIATLPNKEHKRITSCWFIYTKTLCHRWLFFLFLLFAKLKCV